jgi:hypothetical protein
MAVGIGGVLGADAPVHAQSDLPVHLRDRGTGLPTSMFGTYIRHRELLVYPFYEYYGDGNFEYKPSEMGHGLNEDFRGTYHAHEALLFVSYGFTDWLAAEIEAAYISARFEKAPEDPSTVPAVIEESGTGDVEGQLRARLLKEAGRRPEVFTYFEAVSPQQKEKVLIGTPDWELKLGVGAIRGFEWGTMTARIAAEYVKEDQQYDYGEYALEYLKRISPEWRIYAGIEGTQDETALIAEAQWHFSDSAFLKLNNSFGLTSKATDWAPEIGVMFSFGGR